MLDFILSRYNNVDYIMKLPLSEFLDLYLEGKESERVDRMWLAYVVWRPEESFKDFITIKPENLEEVYIDQIVF